MQDDDQVMIEEDATMIIVVDAVVMGHLMSHVGDMEGSAVDLMTDTERDLMIFQDVIIIALLQDMITIEEMAEGMLGMMIAIILLVRMRIVALIEAGKLLISLQSY
jgi:hypothetical protein